MIQRARVFGVAALCLVSTANASVSWRDAVKQPSSWYVSAEAEQIADNVLLYQRDTGAWPKNIDMALPLLKREQADIVEQKSNSSDSTIDNGATYTQIEFLARVNAVKPQARYQTALLAGIDYLLKAQYANGGWPQYFPNASGYHKHITFNDDAMIGVLRLLRDIATAKPEYAFVDDDRRQRVTHAVERGIDCILKTQVIVRGHRTVWGAQHHPETLAPARGRTYELVALSGGESVGIVRFLMEIDRPSDAVIDAIQSAVRWFASAQLHGIRYIKKSKPGGTVREVVRDAHAGPIWARFYEIDTNRPMFAGRDGVKKYDVNEIEAERRNGYAWYVSAPATLLAVDYPAWQQKHLRKK